METLESTFPEACIKLRAWGDWSRDLNSMGYPSTDITQAANEGGGINTRGSGIKMIPDNCDAEEVETILIELSRINLPQFQIIKCYFINKTMPIKAVAKKMKRPYGSTRTALWAAVGWIAGKLHTT